MNSVEKYMIYLEISRYNTDINQLNCRKIRFLEYYLKIVEFKLKFIIVNINKFVPIDKIKFEKVLNEIKVKNFYKNFRV